ncbi:hypothetical protein BDZ91DRAFT_759256 [Kalaharituber pfeilii]|nr:hypothetical protein BDZ91DRAFT_759256 [Kalaharituber pfeilii]
MPLRTVEYSIMLHALWLQRLQLHALELLVQAYFTCKLITVAYARIRSPSPTARGPVSYSAMAIAWAWATWKHGSCGTIWYEQRVSGFRTKKIVGAYIYGGGGGALRCGIHVHRSTAPLELPVGCGEAPMLAFWRKTTATPPAGLKPEQMRNWQAQRWQSCDAMRQRLRPRMHPGHDPTLRLADPVQLRLSVMRDRLGTCTLFIVAVRHGKTELALQRCLLFLWHKLSGRSCGGANISNWNTPKDVCDNNTF